VLLTLMIMGMILTMITQILTSARTTRDTIHNLQENQLAGPTVLDLIEADLRGIFVTNRRNPEILRVRNQVKAGRDADSIDFVTSVDSRVVTEVGNRRFRGVDVNEVGYRLRPNPDDDDFLEIWRRESFGVDEFPFDGGTYSFLHDRVKAFDILVFAEDGTDAEEWESWGGDSDENRGLPTRLEISLTLELAPRISREQLRVASIDARTVTYRRVIRLPQALFLARQVNPVPIIPIVQPPKLDSPSSIDGAPPGPSGPDGGPSIEISPEDLPFDIPPAGGDGTGPGAGIGEILKGGGG